jgi:DoxX-like family
MKKYKIIFWITTSFIFLFDGVASALTWNTPLALEGIHHLGYPYYFGPMLMVFKVLGSLVLILPMFKGRYKEWAYAGFAIEFISAAVSYWVVDGFGGAVIFPIVVLGILVVSYVCREKMMHVS